MTIKIQELLSLNSNLNSKRINNIVYLYNQFKLPAVLLSKRLVREMHSSYGLTDVKVLTQQ